MNPQEAALRTRVTSLEHDNARLKLALEFYADAKTWTGLSGIAGPVPWRPVRLYGETTYSPARYDLVPDLGETAKKALEKTR